MIPKKRVALVRVEPGTVQSNIPANTGTKNSSVARIENMIARYENLEKGLHERPEFHKKSKEEKQKEKAPKKQPTVIPKHFVDFLDMYKNIEPNEKKEPTLCGLKEEAERLGLRNISHLKKDEIKKVIYIYKQIPAKYKQLYVQREKKRKRKEESSS